MNPSSRKIDLHLCGKALGATLMLWLGFSSKVLSQSNELDYYRLEKELVLNAVGNSIYFDSLYQNKKVFFLENDLLAAKSLLKLTRKDCQVGIFSLKTLEERQIDYVGIGDFTMATENPRNARIQIYSSSPYRILNLRLIKKEDT